MNKFGYINELDIFENNIHHHVTFKKVQVIELKTNDLLSLKNRMIYLKSPVFAVILEGNGEFMVNFKNYNLAPQSLVLLSYGHIIEIQQLRSDFRCLLLYTSLDFIEEMYNSEMIYKKAKFSFELYKQPIIPLREFDFKTIIRRLHFIEEMIELTEHMYYKEMILEALQIYFLDLSSIIVKREIIDFDLEKNSEELYFQKFLNLLLTHFKEEQYVDYYASNLHITSQYLNKITKKTVGETVSKMIENLLFAEARAMLQNPLLSIKEIADDLKFSDQSAFGKFFKRNAGVSAKQYRIENK